MATFYCLPKVHKGDKTTGRPIVSGVSSLIESASKFIDVWLRPHVESLSSYIKDTIHFLKTIDDFTFPSGAFLMCVDIECLHNRISDDLGLEVVQKLLKL